MHRDIIHIEHNSDLSNNYVANELNSDTITTDGEEDKLGLAGVHEKLDMGREST